MAAIAGGALAAEPVFTPEAFRAHVAFLADDLLEGRDIGSRGHEIAARYVASRFEALGLKPAGDAGGWYQNIAFAQAKRGETRGTLSVTGPGGTKTWPHLDNVIIGINPAMPKAEVSAPLVFVGYGLEVPGQGYDDYRGLDVRGKIVVMLAGFPKGMPSEIAAYASDEKGAVAGKHGAIGIISIDTLASAKRRPFSQRLHFADGVTVTWIGKDGVPYREAPEIRLSGFANGPAAEALFAGGPKPLATVLKEAAVDGVRPKGFALKTSAKLTQDAIVTKITSPNVVAMLPGADPKLKDEYVVLSAHLDHIGIAPAKPDDKPDTDRINNGALDNAAGIATMLEVARAMSEAPARPRRSVIFLASTGEEKGLLGADYYARNPTVPLKQIVGNVDIDMPLLLYKFTDVVAFGSDHSTLGPITAKAVAPMGLTLSPDPMPEETIFVRSDHYKFVQQGIPAVFLATGFANGGGEQWGKFLGGNYHHPGDDMKQPIDWASGARFAEANYRITEAMADGDTPPLWNKGDFFGDLYAPKAVKAATK
ncbi:M28 family metallopeptidase [Sphingomonas sp.]|uniref:M28 family metallopeptidase n=1 Tax=Sphingomonas sp. TaxID=28214 RepID=UPI0025D5A7FE|nr:M28 family metallopeptidase [Sphingomonas sp.]